MNLGRFRKPIGGLLIILALGGCANVKTVHHPGGWEQAPAGHEEFPLVHQGQDVVVHLKSEDVERGEVLMVDEENLTLGRPGNYGYEEITIPATDILRIETSAVTAWDALAGVGIFVGGLVTMMFVWLMLDPPEFN